MHDINNSGGARSTANALKTDAGLEGHPRRWWALAIIDLCLLAITMDNTILNVALPTISRQLNASGAQLQWMVDAYIVVFAGLLLTSGTLGDRLGRRKLLVAGLSVFGLASMATVFVNSPDQLIAIRGVMGLGGALLMPATLSLITNLFSEKERPRAIATWAAVSGVGMVVGPIAGGALLENFNWNAIFLVNVPIVAVGMAGALMLIPESRDEHPDRVDPVGAVLSIAGLATLVFGVIEAPGAGWTAPETFLRVGVGLGLLVAFGLWELHNSTPMFDIRLFARPGFGPTSFAETVAHFALVGGMFALTQYLQFVWGQRPLQAGVSMLPVAFGVIIGSIVATRLLPRIGAKYLIVAGMVGISLSLFSISRLTVGSSYLAFGVVLGFMSLGMGLAMAPATDAIMGAVDKARAGVGSATNDTTRELGSALGVAIFGSIILSGYRDALAPRLALLPGGVSNLPAGIGAAVRDSIGSASLASQSLPGDTGAAVLAAARQSFVSGMSTATLIGAAVVAVGAVIIVAWMPNRARTSVADSAESRVATAAGVASVTEAGVGRLRQPTSLVPLDARTMGPSRWTGRVRGNG
jgi:EmrB/QacA subfamily drug resistance transporter